MKTEFTKFGAVVEATRKSLDAAAKKFEQVDVRTRAIQRSLKGVQSLPSPEQGSDAAALRLELARRGIRTRRPEVSTLARPAPADCGTNLHPRRHDRAAHGHAFAGLVTRP